MNNNRYRQNRNSSHSSTPKMNRRELAEHASELNQLAKELNAKSKPAQKQQSSQRAKTRANKTFAPQNLTAQQKKDEEYYRLMSMTQDYGGMDEGVEYQLFDDRIRENNGFFIDESKEVNPYWKRDDGDYLRRMDKIFLNDQKDYYQNVSLSYRFPIAYMLLTTCAVFVGIPVLLFLGMLFLMSGYNG